MVAPEALSTRSPSSSIRWASGTAHACMGAVLLVSGTAKACTGDGEGSTGGASIHGDFTLRNGSRTRLGSVESGGRISWEQSPSTPAYQACPRPGCGSVRMKSPCIDSRQRPRTWSCNAGFRGLPCHPSVRSWWFNERSRAWRESIPVVNPEAEPAADRGIASQNTMRLRGAGTSSSSLSVTGIRSSRRTPCGFVAPARRRALRERTAAYSIHGRFRCA